MYIAALLPPNNVDIAFSQMKRELFYEKTLLSAWALGAIVPFDIFSAEPEKPERSELPQLPGGGLRFADLSQVGHQFFLESDECLSLCSEIGCLPCFKSVSKVDGQTSGGFSSVPGLHLFDVREDVGIDADVLLKEKLNGLKDSETLWRGCSLSLIKAEFSDDLWWERITLEFLWEIPLSRAPKHS